MNYWRHFKRYLHVLNFTFKSLTYNASRPKHHYLDAAYEPLFWCIDHITVYVGLIFVVTVSLLTASVVFCWYLFLLPVIRTYSSTWLIIHFLIAHYLLINIVFHYFKAVFTKPGNPPQGTPMEYIGGAVLCKKCIQPKPPRTHHCSICDKCYLKMDHHCPWMNNCIGFHNHRYFVLFCIFMWFGTVYVSLSSFNLFTYHFYHPGILLDAPKRAVILSMAFGLGPLLEGLLSKLQINSTHFIGGLEQKTKDYQEHPGGFAEVNEWEHVGIIYLFMLCSAVTVALALLNVWHLFLISKGETSIEVHTNSSERKKAAKYGMGYNNPYHYGWKENWKILLGLYDGRSALSVLFPSSHKPEGDGITWRPNNKPVNYPDPKAYERYEKTKNIFNFKKMCPC